jgi:DNA oxidative demethylase
MWIIFAGCLLKYRRMKNGVNRTVQDVSFSNPVFYQRKATKMNKKGIVPEGFSYTANILTIEEQSELLHEISALKYLEASFRGKRLKRTTAQFGYAYQLKGKQLGMAEPMPSFILNLAQRALLHCTPDAKFNQCIITKYPPTAGIGWHTDAPKFGDLVVGMSLGGVGQFQFRPKRSNLVLFETTLEPGSIYLMGGSSRSDFEHRILPVKIERYSIVFRFVAI